MPPGDPALPSDTARWSVDELIPFGKYILLNKISSGATAAVYRAKIRGEAGFERLLTIKRILPQMAGDHDFVETFVEEAKICARLNHSSICPTYELGKVGESLYLAMEWVAGKDLGAIVRRLENTGKVMPPLIAAWIAGRLCDALDYAHALRDAAGKPIGIVHQDLSPSNIVISYEGQVKLIDFGLAKAAGRAQQTNVDALKQKIGYMSPELVLGTTLDARSDVFGVGVCLYEMVTGRRLFAGADDIATLKLVSSANVPPPSALVDDTPEDLEMIMMRALERNPDKRWRTAGEMGQALTACIAGEDPTFGTRHVADFMRELFTQDMAAEQRRLNDLLTASKDAALIEQRRRFFTSPLGAAAIAKAEASRRVLNTLPPPPKLKAPPPAVAVDRHTPTEVDPVHPAHLSSDPPALDLDNQDLVEEELTTFRPERRRPDIAPPPPKPAPPATQTREPADEEELTTFRPPDTLEEELTTFHTSDTRKTPPAPPGVPLDAQGVDRPTTPPSEQERAVTPEYGAAARRDNTPVRVRLPPGVTPAFEEEATSYFDVGRRESKKSSQGPFGAEEEATHIFFSAEEGIGLIDSLQEMSSSAPAVPRPLGTENAAERRRTPSEVRAKQPANLGKPLGAPSNRGATQSGGHKPFPLEAPPPASAAAGGAPRLWPARIQTIDRGPTLEMNLLRRGDRGPLLFIGLAMLAATLIGLIVKTPLGIAIGIRKPTEGAIEVRTVPPVAAAVRLDGIYRGRAPLRLEGVRSGDRMLALEADGYVTVARRVTVEGGNTASVNIALEAQPTAAAAPAP